MGAPALLFALACGGGASVSPVAHLEPVCEADGGFLVDSAVLKMDLPVTELPRGEPLTVTAAGFRFQYELPENDERLRDVLKTYRDREKLIEGKSGGQTLVVVAAPDAPAGYVATAVGAARDAEFTEIVFVVESGEAHAMPAYPDAAYAVEFKLLLAEVSPDMRATMAAAEISDQIQMCPGAVQAFEAVAMASPEIKCTLMAAGLEEALPSCPLTDGDRVITAFQVLMEPQTDNRLTGLAISAEDAAKSDAWNDGGTWADVAGKLQP